MYSHLEEPVLGRYSPKGSQPHNNLFRKMLRKLNEAMQSSRGRLQANLISDQGCLNLAKVRNTRKKDGTLSGIVALRRSGTKFRDRLPESFESFLLLRRMSGRAAPWASVHRRLPSAVAAVRRRAGTHAKPPFGSGLGIYTRGDGASFGHAEDAWRVLKRESWLVTGTKVARGSFKGKDKRRTNFVRHGPTAARSDDIYLHLAGSF
ncbi:hypothetical protein V6N13_092335 [Hibiscus sabdariffa]